MVENLDDIISQRCAEPKNIRPASMMVLGTRSESTAAFEETYNEDCLSDHANDPYTRLDEPDKVTHHKRKKKKWNLTTPTRTLDYKFSTHFFWS